MSAKGKAPRCKWCRGGYAASSDYEQRHLSTGEWSRLCQRCAARRLNNPFTGLFQSFRRNPVGPLTTNRGETG